MIKIRRGQERCAIKARKLERHLFLFFSIYHRHISRAAFGVVYVWFGILKFFPNLSSAEALASKTVEALTLGYLTKSYSMPILAAMECALGLLLMTGIWPRLTFILFLCHMAGTFTPFFLFPELTFAHFPYVTSLEGQYIVKNLVLISLGIRLFLDSREVANQGVIDHAY